MLSAAGVTASPEFPVSSEMAGKDAAVRSGFGGLRVQGRRFLECGSQGEIKAGMKVKGKKNKKMKMHIAGR